jgi:hypothetical protein
VNLGGGSNSGLGVAFTANYDIYSFGEGNVTSTAPVSIIHRYCGGGGLGGCITVTLLDGSDVGTVSFSFGVVLGGFMTNSIMGPVYENGGHND